MLRRANAVPLAVLIATLTGSPAHALAVIEPGTWAITGTIRLRLCAGGHCRTRTEQVSRQTALSPTLLTGLESFADACTGDPGDASGLTEFVPARRGAYRLHVLDPQGVAQWMANCLATEFQLRRLAARVRVGADGRTLAERLTLRGRVRSEGRVAAIAVALRVHGGWLAPE
jgi:hypothetical protein